MLVWQLTGGAVSDNVADRSADPIVGTVVWFRISQLILAQIIGAPTANDY
ncbi:hypothetical protein SH449x_001553 [Pirellulaceae bacterium SH449]